MNEKDHYLKQLSKRAKEIENRYPLESKSKIRMSNIDPLIQSVRAYLKSSEAKRFLRNDLIYTGNGYLSIEVSKCLVDRALRFYNSFILLCADRGHTIKIQDNHTVLEVLGEEYKIRVREKSNRIIDNSYRWSSTKLVPNGKLSLKIDSFLSKEWTDTKNIKLEDQLPKLVAAFELLAERDIVERKEREIYRENQARLRKIEEEKQAKIKWENQKARILIEHSKNWNEAQIINAFVAEIASKDQLTEKQLKWITWAKKVAMEFDPLSNGLDNLLDKYDFKNDPLA
ncbi:MAG: hypothetical protein R2730_00265 [Chitinophagales bacterium]